MQAWWWILITAQLVCGDPKQFKDDYKNTIKPDPHLHRATEDRLYPSFIFNPQSFYSRSQISSSEGDEREKKQMRFHSWGGKRYGEEEEEIGDNSDTEENAVFHKPADEDSVDDVSSYVSSNASSLETDGSGDSFRESFQKRKKPSLSFSSWGGKRDPEIMNNDKRKRTKLYSPISQNNILDSKAEQSRKRYPFFSSWAGKRSEALSGWGEKTGYSEAKINFKDETENTDNSDSENTQDNANTISNLLDSREKFDFNDHDSDITNEDEHFLQRMSENKDNRYPRVTYFLPQFKHTNLKRAAAFNSWGGKRTPEDNPVIMKKPASFNSWAGKRLAAFNSWGGKRERSAAFNSWGGKRERATAFNSWGGKRPAAFNSWGGKRAAAFNSWGGKRAAAFNSWGGKRAAAFNSWGGKRAAAFNSWGGKRAAAFNSWDGKRIAAFNSWSGKKEGTKWNSNKQFENPNQNGNVRFNDVHFPVLNSHDTYFKTKTNEHLQKISDSNKNQDYIFERAIDNNLHKTKDISKNKCNVLLNDKKFTKNVETEEVNNHIKDNNPKRFNSQSVVLEKRFWPSFASWASKRSPLFSSWYDDKIPTVLLTSGKRRPAFSSWGGKRSEHKTVEQQDLQPEYDENTALHIPEEVHSEEEKLYTRKRRDLESSDKKQPPELQVERDKRSIDNVFKHEVYRRMMIQGGWPSAFQSMPQRTRDFFAWGGKRSFDVATLR